MIKIALDPFNLSLNFSLRNVILQLLHIIFKQQIVLLTDHYHNLFYINLSYAKDIQLVLIRPLYQELS
jgi:hypothetical protein